MVELLSLKSIGVKDIPRVGKKAAYLGVLAQKYNVPAGYVLPKSAFEHFIRENNLAHDIRRVLNNHQDLDIDVASEHLQALVLKSQLPKELQDAITEGYYSLNIRENLPLNQLVKDQAEPVAVVRTSPLADAPGLGNINLIHVKGREKILQSVVACYASALSSSSLQQCLSSGAFPSIAVIIQTMIMPHLSGRIRPSGEHICIEACYGTSDQETKFDTYTVSRDLEIRTVVVDRQRFAVMQDVDSDRLTKVELSEAKAGSQKLSEKQILTLARLWKRACEDFQADKRIDFVIDSTNYYFVQASDYERTVAQHEGGPEPAEVESHAPDTKQHSAEDQEPQPGKEQDLPERQDLPEADSEHSIQAEGQAAVPDSLIVQADDQASQNEDERLAETGDAGLTEEDSSEIEQSPEEMPTEDQMLMPEKQGQTFEEPDEPNAQEEPEIPGAEIHPIQREEWLETLDWELARALINIDMIVWNAIRTKYSQVFGNEPETGFEQTIRALSAKTAFPYEQDIRRVRQLRNGFLEQHRQVSVGDLRAAYETAQRFLNEF